LKHLANKNLSIDPYLSTKHKNTISLSHAAGRTVRPQWSEQSPKYTKTTKKNNRPRPDEKWTISTRNENRLKLEHVQ